MLGYQKSDLPEAVKICDEVEDEAVEIPVLLVGDPEGYDLVAVVRHCRGRWHVEVVLAHVVVTQVSGPKFLQNFCMNTCK